MQSRCGWRAQGPSHASRPLAIAEPKAKQSAPSAKRSDERVSFASRSRSAEVPRRRTGAPSCVGCPWRLRTPSPVSARAPTASPPNSAAAGVPGKSSWPSAAS
eukprot:11189028-Lingulodinium_polyedra.AAC.1